MELESSRHLNAPPDVVWSALNDTAVLKQSIAGCESLTAVDDRNYVATMKLKIGPVAASFNSRLALDNVVPGRSYTLVFDGQGGVAGFGKGRADVSLEPRDGGTELRYKVNAQVGGKIAQVGQRLIDGVARKMAEDFFARFEVAVVERPQPAAAAAEPPLRRPAAVVWVIAAAAIVAIALLAFALLS
jgi:carbon monoxide dehydrogenase subunit G